jgi:hypothetical protein
LLDDREHYPKWTKLYCLALGMSEQEISDLLNAEPAIRTRKLLCLFDETPEDEGKRSVLHLLCEIGDEESSKAFRAKLLRVAELSPRLKSLVTLWDSLSKSKKQERELRLRIPSRERPRATNKPAKILAFRKPID